MIDYEIIDKYLSDELSEADKKAFELQIQNDAALQEAVQLYATITKEKAATVVGDENTFRQLLQPNQQQYFGKKNSIEKPKQGKLRSMLWLAAAAAAIAIVVFTLYPFGNKNYTNAELYTAYNIVENVDEVTRGANEDILFSKAATFYNTKNYDSAIVYLEQIKATNVQAMYLLGNSYLQTRNYNNAIQNLDILITGNSIYKEKAKYTKAVVHLAMDNRAKAKEQLNTITAKESYYKKAQEILEKLQ